MTFLFYWLVLLLGLSITARLLVLTGLTEARFPTPPGLAAAVALEIATLAGLLRFWP